MNDLESLYCHILKPMQKKVVVASLICHNVFKIFLLEKEKKKRRCQKGMNKGCLS